MKKFNKEFDPFPQQVLEQLSHILVDGDNGLKGSQIEHALRSCKIDDIDPNNTKWKRLYNAFCKFQNEHGVGNHVLIFIKLVMNPASYTQNLELFNERKSQLNIVLALSGYELLDSGIIHIVPKAVNLQDALQRAARLKSILAQRKVHPIILTFCIAEVIQENYFHAVLEAMKSITARIRSLSGLDGDGAKIVNAAFGGTAPKLCINSFDSESKQKEQTGFVNLLIGLYGMIRNPLAHEPKIEWKMQEQDAVDILTTISFIHRKIDYSETATSNS